MGRNSKDRGFTLLEIMMVVVILGVLAAVAITKLGTSGETARINADIATAHQLKSALDRYQVETGLYPKSGQITANAGVVTAAQLIPNYISKLGPTTTQQRAADNRKGFGVTALNPRGQATNLIMIYLTDDGSAAEVCAFNTDLSQELWSSAD